MTHVERDLLRRLLAGSLDRAQTLEALDLVRRSDDCRHYLEEQSRLQRGLPTLESDRPIRRPLAIAPSTDAAGDDGAERISSLTFEGGDPAPRRRPRAGLRGTLLLGVVVILLFGSREFFRDRDGASGTPGRDDLLIAAGLDEGLPTLATPRGRVTSRPKVLAAILPVGESRFDVSIFKSGAAIYFRTWRADDEGANFEVIERSIGDRTYRTTEAYVPFPSRDDVTLETDTRLYLVITLPNGNESAPVPLDIAARRP